ncbi:hypothetical protein EDC30_102253 [Paucimonas lemoignei]|uniref:Uncharacterized protein n=1 Tax=Paucimonas lemoignei TaxID=29443 RepID=A0A4R3I022_PAULE|nr:hypothetical protein [Paucimonas lemoignei]TCS38514.1 hypothetical protein EDC30_102253 [Paucimonas lemoignei]
MITTFITACAMGFGFGIGTALFALTARVARAAWKRLAKIEWNCGYD